MLQLLFSAVYVVLRCLLRFRESGILTLTITLLRYLFTSKLYGRLGALLRRRILRLIVELEILKKPAKRLAGFVLLCFRESVINKNYETAALICFIASLMFSTLAA
jgi:hypothetical protein